MKIEIDTKSKTIKVLDEGNLGEIVSELESLLGKKWKEYKLIQKTEYITTPYVPFDGPGIQPPNPLPYSPTTDPDWLWRPGTIMYDQNPEIPYTLTTTRPWSFDSEDGSMTFLGNA